MVIVLFFRSDNKINEWFPVAVDNPLIHYMLHKSNLVNAFNEVNN